MRIKPGDMIVGHPALEIRKLLQYDERFSFSTGSTITTIEEVLKVSISIATQIYQDLCKEGYIELVDASKPPNGEEILWHNTTKGNGLAHATAIARTSAMLTLLLVVLSLRSPSVP
jgi:Mn-dependent DtxR family transcriptional regulator